MGFLIFVFHADGTRSRPPGPARPWQPSPPRNRGHGGARDWTRPRPQGWPGDREPIPAPHPLFRLPLLTMGRRNLPGMQDPFCGSARLISQRLCLGGLRRLPAFRRLGVGPGGLWPGGCARLGGALRRVVRLLFAWAVVFSLAPAAVVAAVVVVGRHIPTPGGRLEVKNFRDPRERGANDRHFHIQNGGGFCYHRIVILIRGNQRVFKSSALPLGRWGGHPRTRVPHTRFRCPGSRRGRLFPSPRPRGTQNRGPDRRSC